MTLLDIKLKPNHEYIVGNLLVRKKLNSVEKKQTMQIFMNIKGAQKRYETIFNRLLGLYIPLSVIILKSRLYHELKMCVE